MAKEQTSVTLETHTIKRVDKAAKADQRKFSPMLDILVNEALDEREKKRAEAVAASQQ